MREAIAIAGVFGLAALSTALLAYVLVRARRSGRGRHRHLDERLAETHTERRTHLEAPPTIRDVVAVDRTEDGEPIVVPIVHVDLGSIDVPSLDLVFEFVASVLEAIHPELRDGRVRHYDVHFEFGPDGLFVSRLCQRVSVPPELADRLLTDDRYRAFDLRRDVERGDDGDERTAPVLWGKCTAYDDE